MIWVPVFLLAIWNVHPWFGIVGIVAVCMLLLLMMLSELATKHPLARGAMQSAMNSQRAETIIRNAPSIHAMGMGKNIVNYWQGYNSEALEHTTRGGDRAVWFTGMAKAVRLLIQVSVYATGSYLILNSSLTTGSMMACSIILARALSPIEQLTAAWKHFVAARNMYGRITRLLDILDQDRALMLLPAPTGRLVCDDVLYIPRKRAEPALMEVLLLRRAWHGSRNCLYCRSFGSRQIHPLQDDCRDSSPDARPYPAGWR